MALLPLLIPAGISLAKTAYTALNKPKLREPRAMIETLDKQIANNSSDIVNKTLLNTTTSAAKSTGARLYQQQERGISQLGERGLLSEGQQAQAMLDAGTQIQGAVSERAENMLIPQIERNAQIQQQTNQARLMVAQMKDEARARLDQERQQWQSELAGGILDTATSAFGGIMQNIQNKKVTEAIGSYLQGKGVSNITDLDDDGLSGLLTTLVLAKSGITPLVGGVQATGQVSGQAPEVMLESQGQNQMDSLLPLQTPAPNSEALPGNIDPNPANFPRVSLGNGQYGTVKTISIGTDQGEVLIPTIWDGQDHSEDQAIQRYYETGLHFGIYPSIEQANTAAQALHESHQAYTLPDQAAPTFDMDAFNRIANKPAYRSILTKLNTDFGGNVDDPAFRAWVRQNYTASGTLDKFLRAYNAGRGQ